MKVAKLIATVLFFCIVLFVLNGGVHKIAPWLWKYDKEGHAVLYGLIYFFLSFMFATFDKKKSFIIAVLVWILGFCEELRQLYYTDRGFYIQDVNANFAGIAIFFLITIIIHEKIKNRVEI